MPDADRVHARLPHRYQKTYQQLCEGHMSAEELAHNVLKPLKKDIQDYGDGPPALIKQVGESLEEKTSLPLLKLAIDYNAESQNIENLAQQYPGNPRGIALAEDIEDRTKYVITHGREPESDTKLHLRAMLYQVETLRAALRSEQPWPSLSRKYPELGKFINCITQDVMEAEQFREDLLHLYQNYVNEWDQTREVIESGMITSKALKKTA